MSSFPSPPPPMYHSASHGRNRHSLLDSEAALAESKKLEQWVANHNMPTQQTFIHTHA